METGTSWGWRQGWGHHGDGDTVGIQDCCHPHDPAAGSAVAAPSHGWPPSLPLPPGGQKVSFAGGIAERSEDLKALTVSDIPEDPEDPEVGEGDEEEPEDGSGTGRGGSLLPWTAAGPPPDPAVTLRAQRGAAARGPGRHGAPPLTGPAGHQLAGPRPGRDPRGLPHITAASPAAPLPPGPARSLCFACAPAWLPAWLAGPRPHTAPTPWGPAVRLRSHGRGPPRAPRMQQRPRCAPINSCTERWARAWGAAGS